MAFDFDATVVGAGAVGLAIGRALSARGLSVLVMEAKPHIGEGVSSRNSEVIHAGIHYPPGSLKAKFCVEGRRALYAFCDLHGIAYKKCGKLLVANRLDQIGELEHLLAQARENGVEGMDEVTGAQAMAMEPGLFAVAALVSTESGLLASHDYMLNLQGEIEAGGGAVALSTPFEGATPLESGGFSLRAGGVEPTSLTCRLLVTAPGLSSQDVARHIEGFPPERIPEGHFGKGVYFRLMGKAPFERLIYPPPVHGSVGAHYRKDMGGQAVFGPDLSYVDVEDYSVDPTRRAAFAQHIRTFWPAVPEENLIADYAGIRPKLHGPDEPQPDFQLEGAAVHGIEGLVALFGIESPGLTSSLAIGEAVADLLDVKALKPA